MRYGRRQWVLAVGATVAVGAASLATPALARTSLPATHPSGLTPAQIAQLSQNQTERVIVLFRNQHPEAPDAAAARSGAVANDQGRVVGELRQLQSPNVHAYSFLNAIAATVSHDEATRLGQDPSVLAVVPDRVVQSRTSAAAASTGTSSGHVANSRPDSAAAAGSTVPGNVCPRDPSKPLLEPEALQLMNVDFGPKAAQPAAHDLATGKGVKVAIFPDGLDPNLPDFIRPDGTHAIFDYVDFSGDGPNGVTNGIEAFGDASSLISQGTQTYDLSGEVNPAHPLPPGCNIRIKGVAPDASVAVIKVFGNVNSALNSEILQGMDYAVNHDHVNILSESFGGNPVPNPGTDPIALFDQDAVAAGITVVASSGDAGVTNTIGTPATNSAVISTAATTSYQLYAQTTSYGIQLGNGGFVSDQISGLSSSGVTEANTTVDVAAPGEANWADCSLNTARFTGCADFYKGTRPQPIVAFGGTSESAPLTSGTAALVIQGYRDTHKGATPSPALVKLIIKSTARNINARGADQGAGLVDALRAVQAARSVSTADGAPALSGTDVLLYYPTAINQIAAPGSTSTNVVNVKNVGSTTETVTPSLRLLNSATTIASGTLSLNESRDPTFIYQNGSTYGDVHRVFFNVPANTNRLHAAIAWDTAAQPNSTVRFDLFDPQGRLVLQSRPQGAGGGFSEVEASNAQAGTWQLVTFAAASGTSYTGPLVYTITSQAFVSGGTVTPSSVTLAPGQYTAFRVTTTTPSTPGDQSMFVDFGVPTAGPLRGVVPITQRSLVPVSAAHGGHFSGTLTGGNARMPFYAQELPYQFDIPGGTRDIEASLHVNTQGYQVLAFLVDPYGTAVDVQSSQYNDQVPGGPVSNLQDISLARRTPVAGRWSLFVVVINSVSSLQTSTGFSGTISFNKVAVSVSGLPTSTSTVIPHGTTRTATVHVTNNGTAPEAYMIDPRLSTVRSMSLSSLAPTTDPLPISDFSKVPQFVVPPFTQTLTIAATSTVPITLDISPNFGTPDVEANSFGNAAVATVSLPEVPASLWSCPPAEQGPFGNSGAPTTTFTCGASAQTNPFDPAVTSTAGNAWSDLEGFTNSYSPLILQPGQSGDITVTFAPTDSQGTAESGFLAVETFNPATISSDELTVMPYRYTVS